MKKTITLSIVLLFPLLMATGGKCALAQTDEAWDRVRATGELRWGADVNGGAPYVFRDSENPDKIIGFEIDIMNAIAKQLHVKAQLVIVPWDQLVPALLRKDYDLVFNGLEITKERLASIDFTIPYYFFSEQITVQRGEERFNSLKDLHGYRVGALSATLAQRILEQDGHIIVVPYPSPVEVYKDLEIGRIDAALQDFPIAIWYITSNPKLKNTGAPIGEGIYAGGLRKDSPILKEKLNTAIKELIHSGELEKIYRNWNLWTEKQLKLKELADSSSQTFSAESRLSKYIPLLLKGALVTIFISCLAMALAVVIGFLLCMGKLYGNVVICFLCNVYIEVIRGTPLLIQLYLLYYGLPNLGIQLNAFVAAVLGVGLNYAAYEAEIYRSGILSVPEGQMEAARSLGMTHSQSIRYIIVPQAIRTIFPPSTNDFIALFKDTSLVSIITVSELTRAYSQAATTTYRFLELGLMTAALYFLMSFPLSILSSQMEKKQYAVIHQG